MVVVVVVVVVVVEGAGGGGAAPLRLVGKASGLSPPTEEVRPWRGGERFSGIPSTSSGSSNVASDVVKSELCLSSELCCVAHWE